MRQIFGFWYALFLVFVISIAGIARVNNGSVLILSFDGDAIHMAQVVLRMVDGQVPHLDFLTPLGAMAFLPIVWLVDIGFNVGAAFGFAPILISLALFPAILWIGLSRFSPSGAMAFAILVFVQLFAFLHGGTDPTVTVSMYYNNWCWAVSAVVVALCVLPNSRPGRISDAVEPIILGVGVGVLILVKATFAVFLLPAIVLSLLMERRFQVLAFGIVTAVLFMALITVPLGGVAHWQGYISDLLYVARSDVRAQPGAGLSLMILSPAHLVGVVGLGAAFVLFRQAKLTFEALCILLLGGGWVLITHQNWQNDPHWLILVGLILMRQSKEIILYNRYGWPIRSALRVVAVGFIVSGAPLLLAQGQSLLIHNGLNGAGFEPALADPRHAGLKFKGVHGAAFAVQTPNKAMGGVDPKPSVLNGETLPSCQKVNGLVGELVRTGALLDQVAEVSGAQVLYADWINGLWLFGDVAPLTGGAPWYYGGASGFGNADYLVVPLCPMGQGVRRIILETIQNNPNLAFTELSRNDLFILLKRDEKSVSGEG